MIRLFAAITPPASVADSLAARQTGLAGARWRPAETMHVTLRFFGEIAEPAADDLDSELARVGGRGFDLELAGVGAFDEGGDIHAVWAGVAENATLTALARRCETAARRAGLRAETRAWRPHVTLAYLSRPDSARVAAWIQANALLRLPAFRVESFGLFSSRLGAEGSRYRLERAYPLA